MSEAGPLDVLIVGAGFSGLGMAIKLKQRGGFSFLVLEKADSLGGTWRDNHYPGAACDIPSNLYSFSFAQNPSWTRLYPPQSEIKAYLESCADRFGVRPHLRFGAALTRASWDDRAQLWRCETSTGDVIHARALISGMGGLHTPHLPDLAGMDSFQGTSWHSADWRHDVSLDGKRVALIGTGASAIQIAPQVAKKAAQLDLYQRTPPWIVPRRDTEVPVKTRALFKAMPLAQQMVRRLVYAVIEMRVLAFLHPRKDGGVGALVARAHLARQVTDEALRAKLTPNYEMGCKRVLISDNYYPTLQRPNVALISDGARSVTPGGVIDGAGRERPADVILYATGFKPMDLISSVEIIGREGRALRQEWANGPEAYLGTMTAGYPNFFTLMGPNSGLGHNSMIYMIESQFSFVLDALAQMARRGAGALEVKAAAQAAFNADLQQRLAETVWNTGCASWYLSPDGKNRALWPDFTFRFRARTKHIKPADFIFAPRAAG